MSRRVTKKFLVSHGRTGHRELTAGARQQDVPAGRWPRVTKMMALAIRFEQLIKKGVMKDQAEIARLGHVSRARVTQIMNLLYLAPEIQEQILFLPRIESGRDRILERDLREIAAESDWKRQLVMWSSISQGVA